MQRQKCKYLQVLMHPQYDFWNRILRPCTPHAIYIAENTIWESSYFFCGSLMKDTFTVSYIISFILTVFRLTIVSTT